MLDQRFITFLDLCKTMNYTKTAKNLHITQPAVTHHIHYIENIYNIKLFTYTGKNLILTEKGEYLRKLITTLYNDCLRIEDMIRIESQKERKINFGATLTISEYVMPKPIREYINKNPNTNITCKLKIQKFLWLC